MPDESTGLLKSGRSSTSVGTYAAAEKAGRIVHMNSAALRLTAFAMAAMPSAGFPTPQYSLAAQKPCHMQAHHMRACSNRQHVQHGDIRGLYLAALYQAVCLKVVMTASTATLRWSEPTVGQQRMRTS